MERNIQLFKDGELTKEGVNLYFEIEKQIKILQDQQDLLKETIKNEMERLGTLRLTNGNVVIDYYEETKSTTLDTKKLKEECPEIVELYTKESVKKPYVKIWVKKEKKEKR